MDIINQLDFFTNYFDSVSSSTSPTEFISNTILLVIISAILSFIYQKFGTSLSNRKKFSENFVLLSLITMMIISVIRSSLALSLGLVGALSIIRFRSAIKEPEELAYIFLSISLGLAFGAGETELAVIFFILISIVIVGRALLTKRFDFFNPKSDEQLYLSLSSEKTIDITKVISILENACHFVDMKRLDEQHDKSELLFLIKVDSIDKIIEIKHKIRQLDSKAEISILNDHGLLN